MIGNYYYGTGRRKSAVARVFLKKGTGKIVVNEKPADEFFSRDTGRMVIRQPLKLTNHEATFDIMINVEGGARHPRRSRSRAEESRTPQGTQAQAVLEALICRIPDRCEGRPCGGLRALAAARIKSFHVSRARKR